MDFTWPLLTDSQTDRRRTVKVPTVDDGTEAVLAPTFSGWLAGRDKNQPEAKWILAWGIFCISLVRENVAKIKYLPTREREKCK